MTEVCVCVSCEAVHNDLLPWCDSWAELQELTPDLFALWSGTERGGVGRVFVTRTRLCVVISEALSVAATKVVIVADRALCQMTSLVMSQGRWGGAGREAGGCRSADDAGCWKKDPAMVV